MNITQVNLADKSQCRQFLQLPRQIYRDDPNWVPPLEGEERFRLDMSRYPYYRHSEAAFFLAERGNKTVGRLAILNNRLYNETYHHKTAFFHLFECENDTEAARGLFAAGTEWAKQRQLEILQGPRGFTALDGLGLLVKGFDLRPALGLPYNPPYYPELLEAQGLRGLEDIVSGFLSKEHLPPERVHELAERVMQRRGLTIARFKNRRELRAALGRLKSLYNGALTGTTDNIPLTDKEIRNLANQMLWFADPKLIKIVMKGEKAVGFLLAYPDISAGMQRAKGKLLPFGWLSLLREARQTDLVDINGAGMAEEYRGLGGSAILYSELIKSLLENPRYRRAEVVQIGTENHQMLRDMENFGVNFCKVHRLYQGHL